METTPIKTAIEPIEQQSITLHNDGANRLLTGLIEEKQSLNNLIVTMTQEIQSHLNSIDGFKRMVAAYAKQESEFTEIIGDYINRIKVLESEKARLESKLAELYFCKGISDDFRNSMVSITETEPIQHQKESTKEANLDILKNLSVIKEDLSNVSHFINIYLKRVAEL